MSFGGFTEFSGVSRANDKPKFEIGSDWSARRNGLCSFKRNNRSLQPTDFLNRCLLRDYFFQTINFRDRDNYQPFYKLVSNIAAEEWGHVELVASAINLLLTGTTTRGHYPAAEPLKDVPGFRNTYHFFAAGQNALPIDSIGNFWNGSYVHSSGSLKLDLVHNFFLELNARATRLKVYETTSDPTVRELTAFLLVRGSTHVIAYAKALETLSGGVEVAKLFPIPELSTNAFPEARKYVEQGLYNTMYSFRMARSPRNEPSALASRPGSSRVRESRNSRSVSTKPNKICRACAAGEWEPQFPPAGVRASVTPCRIAG
jgi:Mn-containing catalase